MTASDSIENRPRLSVIVPVFEQWELVPQLLASITRQTLPQSLFEVILVENGGAAILVPEVLARNVRIVRSAEPGAYAARNVGVAAARGDIIVFTDADCLPRSNWLEALLSAAQRQELEGLLAGPVEVVATGKTSNVFEDYDVLRGIPQARYVRKGYAATANLLVPRSVFDAVGGFDVRRFSGGDSAFCREAKAAGYGLTLVPDAVVEHPARASWEELAQKARRVKGGQMSPGTPLRYNGILRALIPPLVPTLSFLQQRHRPLRQRLRASAVQWALWFVEIGEVARLLLGGVPERK